MTALDRGSWMQTFTGGRFYPLDPRADEVNPTDIAHALSLLCRYNGHTRRFYSVAEHCVLMSHFGPAEHALWALLHDATETYVGDMIRPLKHHMPEYRAVEDGVMAAICSRFGLTSLLMPDAVKETDNRILLDERAALMTPTEDVWGVDELQPLGVRITGYAPLTAELLYRDRLEQLGALA